MNCPYCNSELIDQGPYGYLASHQSGEILGYTYKCPNHEGFTEEEEAMTYLSETEETLESLGLTNWEEISCWSSTHHVSGSFYTDKRNSLHNGYPC